VADVEETLLPGVGVRHDFSTADGRRLGVIVHRSGRRELLIYKKDDPDACQVIQLDHDDLRVLVEVLGGTQIVERLASIQYAVEGLAIDWISVPPDVGTVGQSLGSTELRTRTGVSVVAVLRGETTYPSPEPDFVFEAEDVAVVVGTGEGIEKATSYFRDE
jgi:TrkA domain protein